MFIFFPLFWVLSCLVSFLHTGDRQKQPSIFDWNSNQFPKYELHWKGKEKKNNIDPISRKKWNETQCNAMQRTTVTSQLKWTVQWWSNIFDSTMYTTTHMYSVHTHNHTSMIIIRLKRGSSFYMHAIQQQHDTETHLHAHIGRHKPWIHIVVVVIMITNLIIIIILYFVCATFITHK